jgi:hypothetical protein
LVFNTYSFYLQISNFINLIKTHVILFFIFLKLAVTQHQNLCLCHAALQKYKKKHEKYVFDLYKYRYPSITHHKRDEELMNRCRTGEEVRDELDFIACESERSGRCKAEHAQKVQSPAAKGTAALSGLIGGFAGGGLVLCID